MVFMYPGAIHIHSIHSDGTGTVEEIARDAKKAGLSWIVITDHNNMEAQEGMYDGVCVIVGEEISPKTENHYLALDIKTPISCDMPVVDFINQVKAQSGFGFIAHPDENACRQNPYKCLPWIDWSLKDFGGLEIWNYMSNWADGYNDKNLLHSLYAFLFRDNVTGPTKKILTWWDSLNHEVQHIIPMIGGVDTHAFILKRAFIRIEIFSYLNIFKKLTNFIYLDNQLPDDFEGRKKAILDAIKFGRNIIINRSVGDGNFEFYIENSHEKIYSGGFSNLDDSSKMIIELPKKANIRIIHNGLLMLQKEVKKLEIPIKDKGKYRIEVYSKKRPWIFSNPIVVD